MESPATPVSHEEPGDAGAQSVVAARDDEGLAALQSRAEKGSSIGHGCRGSFSQGSRFRRSFQIKMSETGGYQTAEDSMQAAPPGWLSSVRS